MKNAKVKDIAMEQGSDWKLMETAPKRGSPNYALADPETLSNAALALAAPFIEAIDSDGEIWVVRYSQGVMGFVALKCLSSDVVGNGVIDTLVGWRHASRENLKSEPSVPAFGAVS